MKVALDLVDQDVAAPTVFDRLPCVPFAARNVLDVLQKPDDVAPRQSCNNLLHKCVVGVGFRERTHVLKIPSRQPGHVRKIASQVG